MIHLKLQAPTFKQIYHDYSVVECSVRQVLSECLKLCMTIMVSIKNQHTDPLSNHLTVYKCTLCRTITRRSSFFSVLHVIESLPPVDLKFTNYAYYY